MKSLAKVLVKYRIVFFIIILALTALCVFAIPKVNLNSDRSKYLPESSQMSKGLKVMNKEFDMETTPDQVRIMFTDLDSNDTENVIGILSNIDKVLSVGYEADSSFYNKKNHTLFVLTTESADANESVMKQLDKSLTGYTFCYTTDDDPDSIPLPVSMTALICVLIIMLLMCSSWIEPIIFFMTIGIAVLLNTGSNAILESVSTTTYGISAILQLVLSMDYSIILSNRYEQACKKTSDHVEAMTNAVEIAIPSVISSSLTTIVGLLALIFMSFTIGADLGIVLAKGVFCSLLCVFTALPALMLVFDKLVILTTKKSLTIPVRRMASLSYRARYILAPIFVLLFIIVFVGKSYAGITYDAMAENEVSKIFPVENQILILYDNSEENKITDLITKLEDVSGIKSITSYSNTLGKSYTASELKETISTMGMDIDSSIIDSIYTDDNMTFTIDELFDLLMNNDKYSDMLSKQQLMIFNAAYSSISSSKSMFVGKEHSRIIISTDLIPGSDEILKLGEDIEKITDSSLKETHYYIGNTIMALEMEKTFIDEMNKITLLTAIAIFIVVMLTFRSIIIPLILVLVIQGAVYLTMTSMAIVNYDMVYLALLIMQCILMGATIDYAIVFTNYYREKREKKDIKEALADTYQSSIRTIATSSLIMICATAIVGFTYKDQTISPICRIISLGVISSIILILVFLPSILAIFDKWIIKKK